jgi:glutamate racemase
VSRQPIGVFDSGLGGLTVVRELMHQLPHEAVVYFGDTARVPYGNKSPDTVRRYSREILEVLLARGAKLVVVACNTASAHALDELRRSSPVPVEGVVEPGARAAIRASRSRRIGVVGTVGTMHSGAYQRAIQALDATARVTQVPCPLFVPLVEEGWLDHAATRLIAHEYLDPLRAGGIDTLVLGCTHYPLLKPVLREVVGPDIALIDSAEETAAAVARRLTEASLASPATWPGHLHCIVSDAPEPFERLGAAFLGERVRDVETLPLGERH